MMDNTHQLEVEGFLAKIDGLKTIVHDLEDGSSILSCKLAIAVEALKARLNPLCHCESCERIRKALREIEEEA